MRRRVCETAVVVLALAGCGGGGGGGSASVPSASMQASANVRFQLTFAGSVSSATKRAPAFLDSATQSLVITLTLVNGLTPDNPTAQTVVNVGPASPNCTVNGSNVVCSADAPAVVGNDTFSIAAFAQPNGAGAQLSLGTTSIAITPGGPNSAAIALGGVVASTALALVPATARGGVASTATLTLTAKDSAGNTIVGSAPYSTPVTVTNSDTTGSVTLSAPSFVRPGDAITVNYGGAAAASSTTFGAAGTVNTAPAALAIMPPHQSLYIVDNAGGLFVFAPGAGGNVAPIRAIAGPSTGLNQPHGVALDAAENIYVTDYGSGSITEYAADANGNAAPLRTISGANTTMSFPTQAPWGIAVDAAGDVYAALINNTTFTGGGVVVFGPGANGNVAPIRTIRGALTGEDDANDVSIDGAGNVHLGQTNSPGGPAALLVFAPGANGNVAPLRDVTGAATSLASQILFQEAYDSSGETYVATIGTAGVSVFAANATGNVAPVRQLSGANTGLTNPRGVAFDAAGLLYVSNINNGPPVTCTISVFSSAASGNVAPLRTIAGTNAGLSVCRFIAINP